MLPDDDEHLENVTTVLLSVLPLVPGIAVLFCRLIVLCRGKDSLVEDRSAENDTGSGEGAITRLDQAFSYEMDNSAEKDLSGASKSYGRVSHVITTPLSVWRQSATSSLLLISLGSFIGLLVGCYMFKDQMSIAPRNESMGLLAMAISSLCGIQFYRREVKKPAYVLQRRALNEHRILREWGMLLFWLLVLGVEIYRLVQTAKIYRDDWAFMNKTFCVLQLLADCGCAVSALAGIQLFLRKEKNVEDVKSILKKIYKSDCFPYIWPESGKPDSPERRAGVGGILTFVWMGKLLRKGRKETLQQNDLFAMKPDDRGAILYARFHSLWQTKSRKAKMATDTSYSLYPILWSFINPSFLFATFIKMVNDSLNMLHVLLLNLMINFMSSSDGKGTGFILCGLLILNTYTDSITINQYFHRVMSAGVRLRSAIATAVYLKSLKIDQSKLSTSAEAGAEEFTSGKIINLMSTDAQRVGDLMSYIQYLWSGPFQIVLISVMLYRQLGYASLGGIAVMLLGIPITGVLTQRTRKVQKKMMGLKDERLKLTTELIQGIKAIKIYSWEDPFAQVIGGIRSNELVALRKSQITNSISRFMISAIPIAVALVSFAIFVFGAKRTLTPAIAFTSLALFDRLRFPLMALPNIVLSTAEATVTIRRLQNFMNLPELNTQKVSDDPDADDAPVIPIDPQTKTAISCKNLYVAFKDESAGKALASEDEAPKDDAVPKPTEVEAGKPTDLIQDMSMEVKLGQYVVLVGRTGCGKSVFFGSLLNEVNTVRAGSISLHGTVALCTQSAWIRSGSVRENILFGKPYDAEWYDKVVDACALRPDFKVLNDGDLTEIGERGVNLSGGQKQRIALARAVYFNAEVYVLDDILSAVDSHVSLHLYKHVIRGLLKDKAVLLATHRFECLAGADAIYMLRKGQKPLTFHSLEEARENTEFQMLADEDEMINTQTDSHEELEDLSHSPMKAVKEEASFTPVRHSSMSPLRDSTLSAQPGRGASKDLEMEPDDVTKVVEDEKKPKALVENELMQEGKVSGEVYVSYIKAGGGWIVILLLILLLVSSSASALGANFWLSHWSDHTSSVSVGRGLLYYGLIELACLLFLTGALSMLIYVTQRAARVYHGQMLNRILHAKMRFFESTPIGRLTNKFSKDLYTIDEMLPMTLYQFLNMFVSVFSILVAISIVIPVMLAIIAPVLVLYYWTERLYVSVARQFKRLDSVSRSPLFTHFAESLDGAKTIRAMRQKGQFLNMHLKYLDENMSAAYIYVASNRWLSVRLECLGNVIVAAVAIFCVLMRSKISSGNAGLALSYAINMTGVLNWLVRMSGERESNIVAVERVIEYNDDENCPQEDYVKKLALPNEDTKGTRTDMNSLPPMQMSNIGQVELVNVALRYRPELPFALRNVSFTIAPGEKVGIVGRTGAGKSSLLVCLLRLVELTEGTIRVHGVDTLDYSVDQLRNEISIIPQDSVIFSGTLKKNLDPFEKASDEELWEALEKACLKEFVEGLPDKLNHPITENGGNISIGQRQLLCLARVLIKRSSILLLDEATSAVDPQTDALIQKCLREEFKSTTIITIAHRLKTVVDYDRIIVMANGGVLEQGNPTALLADPRSEFYSMYNTS